MRTKRPNARLHHTAPAKPATSVTGVVPGPGTTVTLGAGTANAGAAGSVATNGGVRTPPLDVVRQRILATVDPLSSPVISALQIAQRSAAVANLYLGMQQVKNSLQLVVGTIAIPVTPPQLIGVLLQPDGTPGKLLQVQFDPSTIGSAKPMITVQTDANGTFHLQLPQGLVMMGGGLTLLVHGANGNVSVVVPSGQIASNGLASAITLPQVLQPLPVSILAALESLVPSVTASAPQAQQLTNPAQLPIVKVGEDDGCMMSFGANNSVDRFPFGVFYRLVEPRTSIVASAQQVPIAGKNAATFTLTPIFHTSVISLSTNGGAGSPKVPAATPDVPGTVTYVDRVPIEQPLSVDGFRDQLMGLQLDGTFTGDETLPMAGTLGLGYVLQLAQHWTFLGVALGDLVYSLPLAPGEQEEVAIFERVDTAAVTETESFTETQAEQQSALADTSTTATFNSAFNEAVKGTSSFNTNSDSSSWGASLIFANGGSGSSSSSGASAQSLQGQRDTAQQAAESTHSAAQNQASARRSAARTGIRMATASESESVTTKVITNHNHTRALTLQFWEVLRLFDVTTAIDGLTLTVLVPLQVVRFMPPGQTLTLDDSSEVSTRPQVLARYGSLVKHADVLAQALPRQFQYGLTLLTQFASDPTAEVEPFGSAAEDVIEFSLTGTFLPCEDVYIAAVTKRNTRVGPVHLTNPAPAIPLDTFTTKDDLLAWLNAMRQIGISTATGALALPTTMNRADVVGFEISRHFRSVTYTLQSTQMSTLQQAQSVFGGSSVMDQVIQSLLGQTTVTPRVTIQLAPAVLSALGGPHIVNFSATIENSSGSGSGEQYANDSLSGTELPPEPYPIPAAQLAPVLQYNQVLEIERMAQHVVRNTMLYSRAIWASMSADERAVLLEAYTIGVPPEGITDASQMIPLLNCVENRVLGYYGNSMIMPFTIPAKLADAMNNGTSSATGAAGTPGTAVSTTSVNNQGVNSGQLQDALLAYLVAGFKPPHSTIALPTRGVLGEAVLGHCPSAEKIDLTRFWNWQDSPGDTAPQIAPTSLPTSSPSIAAGLTAPNSLTNLPSLINNVLTPPSPDTSLLQALGQNAASQQDFSSALTGAQQLAGLITNAQNTSNQARQDALQTTKALQSQAMATAGNIIGGIYGGNPNAGSNAAAAMGGGQQQSAGSGTQQKGGTGTKGGTSGTGTGTGSTSGGSTNGSGSGGIDGGGGSTSGGGDLGGGATAAPPPPSA